LYSLRGCFYGGLVDNDFQFLYQRRRKMTLSEIKRGQAVQIIRVQDDAIRAHLIRLGIGEGSRVTCLEKIPCGPFMMRHNRQELAIGREIARNIIVEERELP